MGLDDAYIRVVESMAQSDPRTASLMAGVEFDGDKFILPLFNQIYTMKFPECKIAKLGVDAPVPKVIEVLLLHYLAHADGTAVSDIWVTYRQLPGAKLFEQKFINLVSRPMIEFFGSSVDDFRESARALGAQPIDRAGDAAFCFKALPNLPIACILNIGDDEIPPSINILFDKSAPHYLPTEDLAILGGLMNSLLKIAVQTDCRKL